MTNVLLTIIYAIIGLVCISLSVFALRSNEQQAKVGTALFWSILGIIFIFGDWIPANIVGVLIIAMAVLSATKQVKVGSFKTSSEQFKLDSAKKIGNKLFVPALVLAVLAFVIAQFTNLGSYNAIGLSGIGALIVMFFISKSNVKEANDESIRLLSQVGPTAILPQILAALGTLFTVAGVGDVIAGGVSQVIPEGNLWLGVIAYCVGMAVFTAVMGNAFAAFSVITAGIGVPFVFALGANPLIAGALALTAGFCGTLLTPMAANFNIVPASILELKNQYGVIKAQAPFAIIMLIIHIILMRFLAF
ncbi:DUF979 domain-containing protein [Turicibacter sanguinis]|uniref:DUF979 domain-containing protein n=1 Tax=Turicibacter sanguinis TaxID=154288 RepID=UPI0018ABDC2D|nr:DUF979 domain-containing protein [Turicibacter sanguinis]